MAQLSDFLKAQLYLPVIWGGIQATIRPEEYLAHADFACRGEGEECLAILVAALEGGQSTYDILNLACRRDGRVAINLVKALMYPSQKQRGQIPSSVLRPTLF